MRHPQLRMTASPAWRRAGLGLVGVAFSAGAVGLWALVVLLLVRVLTGREVSVVESVLVGVLAVLATWAASRVGDALDRTG